MVKHVVPVVRGVFVGFTSIPLNAKLNPICHLLALLGGATIVVVSRLRVKMLRGKSINRAVSYTRERLQSVSSEVIECIYTYIFFETSVTNTRHRKGTTQKQQGQ